MPILKRRYRRRSPLSFLQLLWLAHGIEIIDAYPSRDREAMRDDWLSIEADLLPAWMEQVPGTRPWAWWQFSAPRPRNEYEGAMLFLQNTNLLTANERRLLDTIPEDRRPYLSFDLRRWHEQQREV